MNLGVTNNTFFFLGIQWEFQKKMFGYLSMLQRQTKFLFKWIVHSVIPNSSSIFLQLYDFFAREYRKCYYRSSKWNTNLRANKQMHTTRNKTISVWRTGGPSKSLTLQMTERGLRSTCVSVYSAVHTWFRKEKRAAYALLASTKLSIINNHYSYADRRQRCLTRLVCAAWLAGTLRRNVNMQCAGEGKQRKKEW